MSTEELTMSYESLVEAGREARAQADNMQWVEGDLALQVEALPADERPREPETGLFVADETKALKRYAEDVDIPYKTVKEYRRVAHAWPTARRLAVVSWGAHQALAGQDDRFELITVKTTAAKARKIARQRNVANNSGKPGWHELIGRVGESLKTASKHMEAFEQAVGDKEYGDALAEKAKRYSDLAVELAERLRTFA